MVMSCKFLLAEDHEGQQQASVTDAVGVPRNADRATRVTMCACLCVSVYVHSVTYQPKGHMDTDLFIFFPEISDLYISADSTIVFVSSVGCRQCIIFDHLNE